MVVVWYGVVCVCVSAKLCCVGRSGWGEAGGQWLFEWLVGGRRALNMPDARQTNKQTNEQTTKGQRRRKMSSAMKQVLLVVKDSEKEHIRPKQGPFVKQFIHHDPMLRQNPHLKLL